MRLWGARLPGAVASTVPGSQLPGWLEALCGLRAQAGHVVSAHSVYPSELEFSFAAAFRQTGVQAHWFFWRFVAAARKKGHREERVEEGLAAQGSFSFTSWATVLISQDR